MVLNTKDEVLYHFVYEDLVEGETATHVRSCISDLS